MGKTGNWPFMKREIGKESLNSGHIVILTSGQASDE